MRELGQEFGFFVVLEVDVRIRNSDFFASVCGSCADLMQRGQQEVSKESEEHIRTTLPDPREGYIPRVPIDIFEEEVVEGGKYEEEIRCCTTHNQRNQFS